MIQRSIHSSVPKTKTEAGVKEYGLHERVYEILPTGHDNPMTTDRIATALGLKHTRTNEKIRKICNELREIMGRKVFSYQNKGYYIAKYRDEVDTYIDHETNRKNAIEKNISTARDIRNKLPARPGSGSLFPEFEIENAVPERKSRGF